MDNSSYQTIQLLIINKQLATSLSNLCFSKRRHTKSFSFCNLLSSKVTHFSPSKGKRERKFKSEKVTR